MGAAGLSGLWVAAAAVAGVIFLFFLLADWWTVAGGGEPLERRLTSLRGDAAQQYREGLLRWLDGFARWVGDGADGRPNHFGASSYLLCLGLAVFYPLFFLTLFWAAAGGPGAIGTLRLFNEDAPAWARLLVLAVMILPALAYLYLRRSLKWPDFVAIAVAIAIAFAGVFAVYAGASAGAVAVDVALAFAFAFAFAVYFASASNDADAFAVGAGAAAVGAGALAAALRADRARRGRNWLIALFALATLASPLLVVYFDGGADWIALTEPAPYKLPPAWLPDWLALSPEELAERNAGWKKLGGAPVAMPLVLFFLFLPALNAPFDWLSLAVSRTLLRWTAEAPRWRTGLAQLAEIGLVRVSIHGLVIVLDAFIALVLACLIVVATAFGVACLAKLHLMGGASGVGFVVSERIAEIRADPLAKEYWWIYAMMFWTLVPTLVHLIAYAAGVTAGLLPAGWRKKLAAWLEGGAGRHLRSLAGGAVLAGLRLLPGLVLLVLLADNFEFTEWVLGLPFELAGKLPGVDFACTEDFTVGTLGTCLADSSEVIAKWVESW